MSKKYRSLLKKITRLKQDLSYSKKSETYQNNLNRLKEGLETAKMVQLIDDEKGIVLRLPVTDNTLSELEQLLDFDKIDKITYD